MLPFSMPRFCFRLPLDFRYAVCCYCRLRFMIFATPFIFFTLFDAVTLMRF